MKTLKVCLTFQRLWWIKEEGFAKHLSGKIDLQKEVSSYVSHVIKVLSGGDKKG
jgi:hypothetical protein